MGGTVTWAARSCALAAIVAAAACVAASDPAAATYSFLPDRDAYVELDSPSENFGASTRLYVDGSPVTRSYVGFTISGIPEGENVVSATLTMYQSGDDLTADGPAVHRVTGAWSENGVTWHDRPAHDPSPLADVGVIGPGVYVDYPVTSAVAGNGVVSFAFVADSSDGVTFRSREYAPDKQAVLTVSTEAQGLPSPPPAPAPPPEPSPEPTVCTKTLAAGGDLSSFLGTLAPGDTGCLRGGRYTDGATVTWSGDASATARIVLTEYPGEEAEIVGTELECAGDYLTIRELTVRDVTHLDGDGISASGRGCRIERNTVRHVARNGILLHTSARDVTVARNFVDDVGWNSSMLPSRAHGIYVQGLGHRIWRNVFTRMRGYGIHIYGTTSSAQPSDIVVAQNTSVDSVERTGLLVRSEAGSNITVVNNVFERATAHTCNAPCLVDNNLVWGGWSLQDSPNFTPTSTINTDPLFRDGEYRLVSASPAVDRGRTDMAYFPHRDIGAFSVGAAPDIGAYEQ